MSLKSFHILFVVVSSLLTFGFAAWCLHFYLATNGGAFLIGAIAALFSGVGLITYGRRFLVKMKQWGIS